MISIFATVPPHMKSLLILLAVFPLLSLMVTACGTFSRIETDVDDLMAERYARTGDIRAEVGELARPLIERSRTRGLVVGVLTPGGSREFFACGVTGQCGERKPGRTTLFAIGSTTKGFLSAAAAVLVQEGILTWDCKLKDLLPEHITLSEDAAEITLHQLATHRSGLPRQPVTARTAIGFMRYLFTGRDFYRHFDREYILNYLAGFRAPAGSGERYSNIGFGILGYALERQTGLKLDDMMRMKLLEPLNLNATGFEPGHLPGGERRAIGHSGDQPKFMRRGRPVPEWRFNDILIGAAGLYSNAEDLLRYAAAHLHADENDLLGRALRDTMHVRYERPGRSRAMAWAVDNVDGLEITFQIGFTGGYSSYIGLDRSNGSAVVVLQNSINWTEGIGHRLLLLMARAE